jgi:hypothetical protein
MHKNQTSWSIPILFSLLLSVSACSITETSQLRASPALPPTFQIPEAGPTATLPASPTLPSPGCWPITEVAVEVCLPHDYTLSLSLEMNRRGSFISYDLSPPTYTTPYLSELQFFSAQSIAEFIANCGEDPCFFGDYPDLERYLGQREALLEHQDYQDYVLQSIAGREYLVHNLSCHGDSCLIREYTTFLGEIKLDIWIVMDDEAQNDQSDQLLTQLTLREE